MRLTPATLLAAAVLMTLAGTAHAQYLVMLPGTPIEGINSGDPATTGIEVNQQNQYPPVNMTDGNPNSSDQTFGDVAYAGLNSITLDKTHPLTTEVTVQFALFYDGGWFGVNHQDSLDQEEIASGGTMQAPLTAADLANLPTMQVTTNGTTWTDVSYTSNYTSQLEGIYHYNEVISPVVTFNLSTPAYDIQGIRLIGTTGGTSDFLGVSEFNVVAEVPEPSTYAMMLAGLALLVVCVRRKGAMVK